jgi:hypothetical protein
MKNLFLLGILSSYLLFQSCKKDHPMCDCDGVTITSLENSEGYFYYNQQEQKGSIVVTTAKGKDLQNMLGIRVTLNLCNTDLPAVKPLIDTLAKFPANEYREVVFSGEVKNLCFKRDLPSTDAEYWVVLTKISVR